MSDDKSLPGQARAVLRAKFGYPDFRRGQSEAIDTVLRRRDALVVLPTGGGKSLCYQVPALVLPGMTVVVSPLISLMHDQVAALERRGIAAAYADSTLSRTQLQDRLVRATRGELKLLYVAPERLITGDLAARLGATGVSLLAVDEAHCISEWGHDFRPSYLRVKDVRGALGSPRVVALTATATPHVRRDIVRQLGLERPRVIVTGFDRPNLSFNVVRTHTTGAKDTALLRIARACTGALVIYASTRGSVERLSAVLSRNGIPAVAYHAGRKDAVRGRAQSAFMTDRVRAIVATNAFGMGVDKPDVRHVVHYAMPGTLEAYYQEAGRGGRDGQPAIATLLHAYADRFTHEFFIRSSTPQYKLLARAHAELRRCREGTDLRTLANRLHTTAGSAELAAVLRALYGCGALVEESHTADRVTVRLVATPVRIREELGGAGDEPMELGLLRALWRAHGERLARGAAVNLAQLPPGLGGASAALPVLEELESRQLLVWAPLPAKIRLLDRDTPLRELIPRKALERHRRHSLQKLRAMEKYAFAKSCRRAVLLRYFGEEPKVRRCNACDNCSG